MTLTDLVVLLFYVIGVFAVGALLSSKVKNSKDMFSASGQAPWWASGLSAFMTMFSAGTFVVWGGIAFRLGFVAIMINLCYGIAALLVGYFVAARWNRLGIRTPAEFVELRFGRGVLHFFTWSMMIYRLLGVAVALYSLAILMVALIPLAEGNFFRDPATGNLSVAWAIILFGGVVVLYTMLGGLWAVLMTDVLQFILLNLSVLFMIPLIFKRIGGVSELFEQAPDGFFAPIAGDYTWAFLAGWVAIHFFMIGAEWAFVQRHICVADERAAKKATYLFGVLYIVSPFFWLLPPLAFRIMNPDVNPEQAYILSCREVLPVGMIGLMLAAMFSATASMVSSQLNVFAGVLTENIYRPRFPSASESNVLWIGRLFSVLLGIFLIVVGILVPFLGGAERVIIAITSLLVIPLLAPMLLGLFSKTITSKAVWLTAIPVFAIGLGFNLPLIIDKQILKKSPEEFGAFATWVASLGKYPEMIIGVALPLAILWILALLSRGTSDGWNRVEAFVREQKDQTDETITAPSYDSMPGYIVSVALATCGIVMLVLACLNADERATVAIFGCCLFAIGGFICWFTRSKSRRLMPEVKVQ